jgi:hypothetical protein
MPLAGAMTDRIDALKMLRVTQMLLLMQGIALAACDYLDWIGRDAIAAHDHHLAQIAMEKLSVIPGIRIIGPRAGQPRGEQRRGNGRGSQRGLAARAAGAGAHRVLPPSEPELRRSRLCRRSQRTKHRRGRRHGGRSRAAGLRPFRGRIEPGQRRERRVDHDAALLERDPLAVVPARYWRMSFASLNWAKPFRAKIILAPERSITPRRIFKLFSSKPR